MPGLSCSSDTSTNEGGASRVRCSSTNASTIELRAAATPYEHARVDGGELGARKAAGLEIVIGIGHSQDPCADRDCVGVQAVREAHAVVALVVRTHDRRDRLHVFKRHQGLFAERAMLFVLRLFFRRHARDRASEQGVGQTDMPDVVQKARDEHGLGFGSRQFHLHGDAPRELGDAP